MNHDTVNLDISFPKDAFIQDNFNVDRFLQEHCSKSGLHKLHEELGIYIKYLQLMMIDIVNAESSAIVNLSSDLKVLQTKYANISTPLGQLKEEVSQIYNLLLMNVNNIQHLIKQKDDITAKKTSKVNELRILISSQKISLILIPHLEKNLIDMEVLERSVDQYILQQMYCQSCNIKNFSSQITQSTDILNKTINNVFLQSLLAKNKDHITRCLQMYMLMSNQKIAENLYAVKVVRPALNKIISEDVLRSFDGNLSELYNRIIEFVDKDMKLLLSIVNKSNTISGFNFILNSAWIEICEQLKLNIPSIYAPGNPTVFHQRFLQTCAFLSKFEEFYINDNHRKEFLQHQSYLAHKNQWNLPVYYEIRHLEIVQDLEKHFSENVSNAVLNTDTNSNFKLLASYHVWISMKQCFNPDIYLQQLLDRFWKLNLQIISRYITWTQQLLSKDIQIKEDFTPTELERKDVLLMNLKLKFLTYLHLDIVNFNTKFENVFTTGLPYLSVVPKELQEIFIKSLTDPKKQFLSTLLSIEDVIVKSIYNECSVYVKHILQIPRLFRKTNRITPSGPSAYLASMSKPINNFYDTYNSDIDAVIMQRILKCIHMKIIAEYKILVENVLTSVAKTEESLRRLKKIRSGNGASETTVITDDQKIRLQVQLDVQHYCNEAMKYIEDTSVQDLLQVTKEADVQN